MKSLVTWGPRPALIIWVACFLILIFSVITFIEIPFLDYRQAIILGEFSTVIPVIVYLKYRRIPFSTLGLSKINPFRIIKLSIPLGFLGVGISILLGMTLSYVIPGYLEYRNSLPNTVPESLEDLAIWWIIVLLAVGPVEEIISRGFVQQGMETRFGPLRGLLISSLLFGIIHVEPFAAINAFFIGLLLGYVYGIYLHFSGMFSRIIHAYNPT